MTHLDQNQTLWDYYISVDNKSVSNFSVLSNIPDFRGLVFFNSLSDLELLKSALHLTEFQQSLAAISTSPVKVILEN